MTVRIIDTCMHNPNIRTYAEQLRDDHHLVVNAGHHDCEPHDEEVVERYNWFLREDAPRVANHCTEIKLTEAIKESDQVEHILMSYQLTWINPNFSVLLCDEGDNRSAVLILSELPAHLRELNTQHNIDLIALIKEKWDAFQIPPYHHLVLAIEGGVILLSGITISEGAS